MIGLAVTLILVVIVAPIVSLIWVWRLSGQVDLLKQKLARMEQGTQAPPQPAQADSPEAEPEEEGASAEQKIPPEVIEDVPAESIIEPSESASEHISESAVVVAQRPAWEEKVASNWMVWLGGLTVALAAVFFFRFAIDQGYLTPLTRVVLGLLGGGLLLAAGEWAMKRPASTQVTAKADFVPPALSAAGIFAIFVSLYAAHALYGLVGPGPSFIAMGLTAYAAIGLALRQGWFVGLLGILAGYVVPALIVSPEPNAVALFLYLFFVTLAALAVTVWRHWPWFSVLTLAGAFLWPFIWMFDARTPSDEAVLGLYLLAVSVIFAVLASERPNWSAERPLLRRLANLGRSSNFGYSLGGVLLILLSLENDFDATSFAFIVVYSALALVLGVWRQRLEILPAVAAAIVLVAFLLWPVPEAISLPERAQEIGRHPVADAFGPFVMPPELLPFSRSLWAFAAVFGIGGFLTQTRVSARSLHAGLSAVMPVILFAIGYWRIGGLSVDVAWAGWAAGLAAILLAAATASARSKDAANSDVPLAFYAAGVTASVALVFACLMREAWLTVALAAEVAALAWIWKRLAVDVLKVVAIAVVAVVAIRLVANPRVITYDGSVFQIFGWVLYGYGLPALLIGWAARVFAREGRDLTVVVCEIAAVGFAALMVAAQLKLWTAGTLDPGRWDFLDLAIQADWWLIASGLLLNRPFAEQRTWAQTGGLIVLCIGASILVAGPLLSANPLFVREDVGTLPFLNILTIAYLLPAALFLVLAWSRLFILPNVARKMLGMGAGLLIFIDITLEVRRAFWGNLMALDATSLPANAEVYTYSAAWTVFALILLGLGVTWNYRELRYASLVVLLITIVKLFLYDMSDLTGLYRVASFLGLGLTLIGIGRIYQKFVLPGGSGEPDRMSAP